jgi:hypothetical protein
MQFLMLNLVLHIVTTVLHKVNVFRYLLYLESYISVPLFYIDVISTSLNHYCDNYVYNYFYYFD